MAAPASRCGHARCRARGALIPHSALPSLCACPYRKTGSHFSGTCANASGGHGGGRRVRPRLYGEPGARARPASTITARHEECRRLLPVRNSAGRHARTRARITLRERSRPAARRPWLGGTGRDDGTRIGLGGTGIGLGGTGVGLDPTNGEPIALGGGRGEAVRRHRENDISLASAAGSGLLSGATSAVTCGTASALRSDLPPASAVTTAALNAKAARAAATVPRHPMTPAASPWRLRTR